MQDFNRRRFLRAIATGLAGVGAARRTLAAGAAPRRPNLLLVFPDQHRPDWTSLAPGVPVRTPNLVRLAEEGMAFSQAYCPSPLCAPSRACLATGRIYGRTAVATNRQVLADGTATFYQRLGEAGYRVGSVGKLDLRKAAYSWGPDGQHRVGVHHYFREWGFTDGLDSEGKGDTLKGSATLRKPAGPYMTMLQAEGGEHLQRYIQWRVDRRAAGRPEPNYSYTTPVPLPDDLYNDNWVGRKGLEHLENFPRTQPWFLQVNFPGPHAPMDITPGMAAWYRGTEFPAAYGPSELSAAEHQDTRRNYSAMVENIDRWLGRYLDALERRGELENTLVVFSSDHGEMLGDHGLWGKRQPFEASVGVPLVVRGPGVKRSRPPGPVATLDLTATFLDYAQAGPLAGMDSRSLRETLQTGRITRPVATSGYGSWRLATDGRYKLIRGFDPAQALGDDEDAAERANPSPAAETFVLYDLKNDPREMEDLAARRPEIVTRLRAHLPAV